MVSGCCGTSASLTVKWAGSQRFSERATIPNKWEGKTGNSFQHKTPCDALGQCSLLFYFFRCLWACYIHLALSTTVCFSTLILVLPNIPQLCHFKSVSFVSEAFYYMFTYIQVTKLEMFLVSSMIWSLQTPFSSESYCVLIGEMALFIVIGWP